MPSRTSPTEAPFELFDQKRRTSSTVIDDLVADQRSTAERVVPWFFDNMHPAYFQQVGAASQRQHLRAIVAMQASQTMKLPEITLASTSEQGNRQYTYIHSGGKDRVARRQLDGLPEGMLTRVLLTESKDGSLSLNVFEMASPSKQEASAQSALSPGAGDGLKRFVVGDDATEAEKDALERHSEYNSKLERGELSTHAGTPTRRLRPDGPSESEIRLHDFLTRCSSAYVTHQLPRLLVKQRRLYEAVKGHDDALVELETAEQGSRDWSAVSEGCTLLAAALPGVDTSAAMRRIMDLLELHRMQLHLAQVDTIDDPEGDGFVTMLRTVIQPEPGLPEVQAEGWERLKRDAMRLKWIDDPALTLATRADGAISLQTGEVVLALANLSLAVLDRPLLSRVTVHERLDRPEVRTHAVALAELLVARFNPVAPTAEGPFVSELEAIARRADEVLRDDDSCALLATMASAVRHVMRTNLFVERRWALALRLEPAFFEGVLDRFPTPPGVSSNQPYGVFFVAGRHFNGYHVRFSDIARGGLRVVLPPSHDTHLAETRRHFNECFRLAWAQQLKNKDIPEGGAKAVCLVYPVFLQGQRRERLMHKCVKKFTDALLDMLCPRDIASLGADPQRSSDPFASCQDISSAFPTRTADPIVSRGGCENELLYLGPDENITPYDINWMAARAAARGYAMPSAFISSKPEAGINHKEFGVTSEGVAVFLHEGLLSIGIDPHAQSFSVKLTGGPDGDVAGNMLRILHREYGARVHVVGIADGFGCAEDPDGIPMCELIRLADASLPIAELNPATLGPRGLRTLANTAEGAAARNTMHNRVVADAFVPAGGRPSTVSASNWREFLQPDGHTPSARLVVEGANLFFDASARASLFEHCRLPIIKDSSANKCGVICSSMEIVACMLLAEEEFKAIKPRYVEQVIERLRMLARLEAQMLFAESARDTTVALPALSERISVAILRVGKALDGALDALPPVEQSQLFAFVRESIPPILFDSDQASARAAEALPWPYQRSCISSGLASRLCYREGLSFVEALPDHGLAEYAFSYLKGEQKARELAALVASAGLSFGAEVEQLLMKGGARAATEGILVSAKAAHSKLAYPVLAE